MKSDAVANGLFEPERERVDQVGGIGHSSIRASMPALGIRASDRGSRSLAMPASGRQVSRQYGRVQSLRQRRNPPAAICQPDSVEVPSVWTRELCWFARARSLPEVSVRRHRAVRSWGRLFVRPRCRQTLQDSITHRLNRQGTAGRVWFELGGDRTDGQWGTRCHLRRRCSHRKPPSVRLYQVWRSSRWWLC